MLRILLALTCFTFVLYYSSPVAVAQQFNLQCFPENEAKKVLKENNEKLIFTGISKNNFVIQLWSSSKTFSIFIRTPNGLYCTSQDKLGRTLELNLGTPI